MNAGDVRMDPFDRPLGDQAAEVASTSEQQPLANLPKACCVLTCNDPANPFGGEQTFVLVGTAHVSTASCNDVKRVIRQVKPEVCTCIVLLRMPASDTTKVFDCLSRATSGTCARHRSWYWSCVLSGGASSP